MIMPNLTDSASIRQILNQNILMPNPHFCVTIGLRIPTQALHVNGKQFLLKKTGLNFLELRMRKFESFTIG